MDGEQGGSAARKRVLRWLAPISSTLLLAFLVARASNCEPEQETDGTPDWLETRPPAASSTSRPDLLKGTKSFGIELLPSDREHSLSGSKSGIIDVLRLAEQASDGGSPKRIPAPLEPEDSTIELLRTGSLGGSKSGFGGLGLRGTGAMPRPDGGVPGLSDVPAQGRNTP